MCALPFAVFLLLAPAAVPDPRPGNYDAVIPGFDAVAGVGNRLGGREGPLDAEPDWSTGSLRPRSTGERSSSTPRHHDSVAGANQNVFTGVMSDNTTALGGEADPGDQVTTVQTQQGTFTVHSAGAHTTRWDSAQAGPLLFLSERSGFGVGVPIRGGIPLCFPWFGALRGDAAEVGVLGRELATVKHGFARTVNWRQKESSKTDEGEWTVRYELTEDDVPKDPDLDDQVVQCFTATFTATFSARTLALAFQVENRSHRAFAYELALHTYFRVGDVSQVRVEGLEGVPYFDKVSDMGNAVDSGPVFFGVPVDRVYQSGGAVQIVDPSMNRRIHITKEGSDTTVVWNPGPNGAEQMADLEDSEWTEFVCVETANAFDDAKVLPPGQTHVTSALYRVEDLD